MTQAIFADRLSRLDRKHRRMGAAGVSYRIDRAGLISAEPRQRVATLVPLRTLALLALGGVALKALLFVALGEGAYVERVASLAGGTTVERAGAWIMQADPATLAAAEILHQIAG